MLVMVMVILNKLLVQSVSNDNDNGNDNDTIDRIEFENSMNDKLLMKPIR